MIKSMTNIASRSASDTSRRHSWYLRMTKKVRRISNMMSFIHSGVSRNVTHRAYPQRGFIALMTVLILSSVIAVTVVTASAASFFSRFNLVAEQNKAESRNVAEGCVQEALLRIAENSTYQPAANTGDSVSLNSESCKICAVTFQGGTLVISTKASVSGSFSNITEVISTSSGQVSIASTSETAVSNFPLCTAQ